MQIRERIGKALGNEAPDMVITGAGVVNVFTGDISYEDVAISDGMIVGVGDYKDLCDNVIDMEGKYVMPGFINAHCHVESSMVTPRNYALAELAWGTTTIITDPHEIVNVAGHKGVEYVLSQAACSPVNYYVALPSCVPATSFENAGAVMLAKDLAKYKDNANVIGLGEMMNYVGVNFCDNDVLDKIEAFDGRVIDGHAPGLLGRALNAYTIAGIDTEHECVTYEEALEKARRGLAILVRQGSASKNEEAILKGFIKNGNSTFNLAFATDDKHLYNINEEGTIRYNVLLAIKLGMDPVEAIQIATINAARIYGLKKCGAIAPGYKADIVVADNFDDFNIDMVIKDGKIVAKDRKICEEAVGKTLDCYGANGMADNGACVDASITDSVHLPKISADSLKAPVRQVQPVIKMVAGQIVTGKEMVPQAQLEQMIATGTVLKIAVIERHKATGNIGVGYIMGYGLKNGAVATTVAHDSHNLIVVGDNDEDMLGAIKEIERIHGGYAICSAGDITSLPLPICGLMSDEEPGAFTTNLHAMIKRAKSLGVNEGIDPFITLSFMALPVIPSLRITDMGLFDVDAWKMI